MKIAVIFMVAMLYALPLAAQEIDEREKQILDIVAAERGLDHEQTLLLYAIRSHESGSPGRECGIEQPCAQYYRDGFMSLLVQADFTAFIIKERWNGNLFIFARSFHHGDLISDYHWMYCVSAYLKKYRKIYPVEKQGKRWKIVRVM